MSYRKYRNVPHCVDNVTFQSKREASRYLELLLLLHAGEIRDLELQPRYNIVVNGVRCGFYKADFRYIDRDGRSHTEDAKSPATRTTTYKLKKKLVEALYPGVRIEEV